MSNPLASSMLKAAVRSTVSQNARMAPKYTRAASHAVDHHDAGAHEEYPPEGFSGAFWRNSVLAVVLSVVVYRVSLQHAPAAKGPVLNESHDPEETPLEAHKDDTPYLTKYLAYHMPRQGLWKERNDKHLELTLKQAEDKLLVQDAQRPKIRRFTYAGMFDNASPHSNVVGGTIDLSDLKIKGDRKPVSSSSVDADD